MLKLSSSFLANTIFSSSLTMPNLWFKISLAITFNSSWTFIPYSYVLHRLTVNFSNIKIIIKHPTSIKLNFAGKAMGQSKRFISIQLFNISFISKSYQGSSHCWQYVLQRTIPHRSPLQSSFQLFSWKLTQNSPTQAPQSRSQAPCSTLILLFSLTHCQKNVSTHILFYLRMEISLWYSWYLGVSCTSGFHAQPR